MVRCALALTCLWLASAAAKASEPLKIMLGSGSQVMWYTPSTRAEQVLHEGGLHYGVCPGKVGKDGSLKTIWVAQRIAGGKGSAGREESMVEVDAVKGGELRKITFPWNGVHDVARVGDLVYVVDSEHGVLVELKLPNMKLVANHHIFTRNDHLNTLAPVPGSDTDMYVMLHRHGNSQLMLIRKDLETGKFQKIQAVADFGTFAHALTEYHGDYLVHDSNQGKMLRINPKTGCWRVLYQDPFEGTKFFKGLNVVDDVAYLGISTKALRKDRKSKSSHGELGAYDLINERLLWRRKVNSSGLINILAAPQLSEQSTYVAQRSSSPESIRVQEIKLKPITSGPIMIVTKDLERQGLGANVSGHWPTGVPHMNLELKKSDDTSDAGVLLPLGELDIGPLKRKFEEAPPEIFGVTEDAHKFDGATDSDKKHGARKLMGRRDGAEVGATAPAGESNSYRANKEILLIDVDHKEDSHFTPLYDIFGMEVESIANALFGGLSRVVRMALEVVQYGAPLHHDQTLVESHTHRVIVPILESTITTQICPMHHKKGPVTTRKADPDTCFSIPDQEGIAYEINNRVLHQVSHVGGMQAGLLLVMDAVGPDMKRSPPQPIKYPTTCSAVQQVECPTQPSCSWKGGDYGEEEEEDQ